MLPNFHNFGPVLGFEHDALLALDLDRQLRVELLHLVHEGQLRLVRLGVKLEAVGVKLSVPDQKSGSNQRKS